MPARIESWPRPHFVTGYGDALLMYRIYGRIDTSGELSASKYRVSGFPDQLELAGYSPTEHPDAFFGLFVGPLWATVRQDNPALADAVRSSPTCVAALGKFPDPSTLDYFRDVIGIATWLLDNGGIAVYDPQMIRLWSADEWRAKVFGPAGLLPRHHVVILTSPERKRGNTLWFHTRGMRKFGRPDLSVRGVGPAHRDSVIELFNRFIEWQAFGGVIPEGTSIHIKSLPDGGICHHRGDLEDEDFNNVHVEIVWPAPGLR